MGDARDTRAWSCLDPDCPGGHPSPAGMCWPKLAQLHPPIAGLTVEDHRWLRHQQEMTSDG